MPKKKKTIKVFVIMPFSKTSTKHTEQYWDRHWEFLKSKINECPNCVAHRSEALRGDILRNIIRDLAISDVVVADLTDLNPNVYWELGVRQSLRHGTVTIAENKYKIAFDMGMKSILRYHPKDAMRNDDFTVQFKKAIQDCVDNPDIPDSHVLETLSGRGSLHYILHKDEIKRKLDALYSEYVINKSALEIIYDNVYFNEVSKTTGIIGYSLVSNCLEHLITTRYLDESDQFYISIGSHLNWITGYNMRLQEWRQDRKNAEGYFKYNEDDAVRNYSMFEKLIKKVMKKF